jgi:aminoglycoside phosphotransferase (APT) family kinase protein
VDFADEVASYLSAVFSQPMDIGSLRRSVGGLSRETWFIQTRGHDGEDRSLTLRLDPVGGSVAPKPLLVEYQVLSALRSSEVPAPEPLHYVEREKWFGGRAAYVRSNVVGSASPSHLVDGRVPGRARTIGRDYATKLAAIHTLDWHGRGFADFFPVPATPQAHAVDDLDVWWNHYEQQGLPPDPEMTELFAWLRENAPQAVPRTSLVWGDAGMGNFIVRDDRIVALLDWEQAHLGDATKDLAASLWRGIEALLDPQEFIDTYQEASGIEVDRDRLAYYSIYIAATYSASCRGALSRIDELGAKAIPVLRLGLGTPVDSQVRAFRGIADFEQRAAVS